MPKTPSVRAFVGWLCLAALVILVDQVTKAQVLAHFTRGEILPVTDFFDILLAFNRGAAFSFLAEHSGWQRWFFAVLALGVSAWIVTQLWQHAQQKLLCTALSMIMGGALGNVIDRLTHGAVVDFLYFHITVGGRVYGWPAFNVADSAICVGVGLMLIAQWRLRG